ncbi:hypothetical protein FRB99_005081 [Tulasnella sp. 403]|nr:hypothetical protein FRB99_005081 [Tulasnella sp. 403]
MADGSIIKIQSPVPINIGRTDDIFQGRSAGNGTLVALKRFRTAAGGPTAKEVALIRNEAMVWERLQHQRVLSFLGTGHDDANNLYLVSPWIHNGALSDYLQQHPDANRPRYIRETADALQYLHSEGIIHGDVKAENVLISAEDHILLCDFGLARLISARTATILRGAGTFLAPEIWSGSPRTEKSDVYAFGITIYQVLSGQIPFREFATNQMALITAVTVRNERPPKEPMESLSGTSYAPLWQVAEMCWNGSPNERPTMRVVYNQLQASAPVIA